MRVVAIATVPQWVAAGLHAPGTKTYNLPGIFALTDTGALFAADICDGGLEWVRLALPPNCIER